MSIEIIQQKLLSYQCQTILEQENALKEMAQEIALMSLSRSGFFKSAAFQGGTCLRLLYHLERFSEDLDFVLQKPNPHFDWEAHVHSMKEEFNAYGYQLEIINKSKLEKNIKSAFLKANSEGGILILKDGRTHRTKLQIKLEIDTNPPVGSNYNLKYLDFPLPFSVLSQDLPSLFASKSHALLCRPYTKGRDWFDFVWYVSRQTPVNFQLLSNAIDQAGPWKKQHIEITPNWFVMELKNKIINTNWDETRKDVERFLKPRELLTLEVWSQDFFLSRIEKLAGYL